MRVENAAFSALAAVAIMISAPVDATTLGFNPNLGPASNASTPAPQTTESTVTFGWDSGVYQLPLQNSGGTNSAGYWDEGGFNVEFSGDALMSIENSLTGQAGTGQAPTGFVNGFYLSNSINWSTDRLGITHSRGSAFSFGDMELGQSFSNQFVFGNFLAEDGSGYDDAGGGSRLNYDNMRLRGTRSDGSIVNVFASTYTDIVSNPNVRTDPATGDVVGNSNYLLQLSDLERAALSDLTSLDITMGLFEGPFGRYMSSAAYVAEGSVSNLPDQGGFSDTMMIGYEECLIVRRQENCTIDGVGEFQFYQETRLFQNFVTATFHGNLSFAVNAAPAPSPVPLPAGFWFLAAATGMLAGLRRRARSNA